MKSCVLWRVAGNTGVLWRTLWLPFQSCSFFALIQRFSVGCTQAVLCLCIFRYDIRCRTAICDDAMDSDPIRQLLTQNTDCLICQNLCVQSVDSIALTSCSVCRFIKEFNCNRRRCIVSCAQSIHRFCAIHTCFPTDLINHGFQCCTDTRWSGTDTLCPHPWPRSSRASYSSRNVKVGSALPLL